MNVEKLIQVLKNNLITFLLIFFAFIIIRFYFCQSCNKFCLTDNIRDCYFHCVLGDDY